MNNWETQNLTYNSVIPFHLIALKHYIITCTTEMSRDPALILIVIHQKQ